MATASKTSVHDFTVEDARGNDVDLSIYKGKVLLIVNVASQCGLTNSNYTELAQLYAKYKDQGGIFGDGIKWNFSKFLVNKDGKVVDRYAPTTSPLSIEKDVKKLLVAA
ncbi:putative phospholipid hydroperoxide glutathione peroxidase [Cucurbita argyrosperma subsp. argyrosperma]|nr:putative phospholipid hydroperoxide glutathione peroxidase [Cucurbita argyrosperma subsp. argyrosperma]